MVAGKPSCRTATGAANRTAICNVCIVEEGITKKDSRLLSRRRLLRGALLGGSGLLAAYALGCGDDDEAGPATTAVTASPRTRTPAATSPSARTPTASPSPAAPAALAWTRLSPAGAAPPPRRDHSLVTDGQRLYAFGGRSGAGTLGDTWAYDIAAGAWREVPVAGPPPRFGHNAVWDGARMVVFGGQDGGTFFNDAWSFEPAGERWTLLTLGGAPAERYGAASALDGQGQLIISHGFTTAGRFDDSWALALTGPAWSDISPGGKRPVERCLCRGAWDDGRGRFLLFGGQTNASPFLGDLWQLKDGTWTEIASEPKPSPRNFYAMAYDSAAQQLLLVGGRTQDGAQNDVWALDAAGDTWSQLSPEGEAPSPRYGHDAAWVAETRTLYVFGGYADTDLDELWVLSVPA